MFIDVGFVTDRDAEDSVIQRWNEYDGADATSWDMKYSCEMERKDTFRVRLRELQEYWSWKRMMKRRRRRTRTMTTEDYKSITWTLVMSLWIFGRFSRTRFRERESGWCVRMKRGGGERDVDSGLRSDRVECCRGRWNCRNLMRSLEWVPIDSLQNSTRPLKKQRYRSSDIYCVNLSHRILRNDGQRSCEIFWDPWPKERVLTKDDRVIWYQTSIICKSIRVEDRPWRHSISSVKRYRVRDDLRHFGGGGNSSSYVQFSQCRQVWVVLSFGTKGQNRTRQRVRRISHSIHCLQLNDKQSSYFKEVYQS